VSVYARRSSSPSGATVSGVTITDAKHLTAVGTGALTANSGDGGTAVGYHALNANTTGQRNTAFGIYALEANTDQDANVAIGAWALRANTGGTYNTAVGHYAQRNSTTASNNTAIGDEALDHCTTGSYNTAVGAACMYDLTTGNYNTMVGVDAGHRPGGVSTTNATTTASGQVLIGWEAGQGSATQRDNIICIGLSALADGAGAIAIGAGASAGANGAVAIGRDSSGTGASTTVANEIKLGTPNHTVNIPGTLKAHVAETTQTGDYTLALVDDGTVVAVNKASAVTVTVPPAASVAFPTGTIIEVYQMGAGLVTVAAGAGVTLRAPNGAKTAKQYSSLSLRNRGSDIWVVSGDTTT
jgi:hypothetical protein